jgi:CubicO group peptidase (beta-lactamase class C family)
MKRWATGLSLVVTAVSMCHAEAPRDVSAILKPILEKHPAIPGLIGAIVEGDHVTAIGVVGVRKHGAAPLLQKDDQIHLGSDTKAMTAILVAQLVDEKKLSFDDTMEQVFPELAPKMNPKMRGVTIHQLLRHEAGLPHDVDWSLIDATGKPMLQQRRMAVEMALKEPPATEQGKYSYSNVSFEILGAIVEKKRGKTWELEMRERLFNPLGMTSGGFGPPGAIGKIDQPWGHIITASVVTPVQGDNRPVLGPAGTVHCSISDWGKFISLVLDCENGRAKTISKATYDELIKRSDGGEYAAGWLLASRDWAGGRTLTHAGSNGMWYCVAWVAPKKNFAVLAASNSAGTGVGEACDEVASELIRTYLAEK